MDLLDLERTVEEEVKSGNLKFIGRIGTYQELDREIFRNTRKTANAYEYLILIPVILADGRRQIDVMDVYGKPNSVVPR